jgi:hypothetical protein
MLRWIMKKLRVSTPKSTPSSEVVEKTSPEPSATFSAETLKDLLLTLSRVQVAREQCETLESALAITRDVDKQQREIRTKLNNALLSDSFMKWARTWPVTVLKSSESNWASDYVGSYALEVDGLKIDIKDCHNTHIQVTLPGIQGFVINQRNVELIKLLEAARRCLRL